MNIYQFLNCCVADSTSMLHCPTTRLKKANLK